MRFLSYTVALVTISGTFAACIGDQAKFERAPQPDLLLDNTKNPVYTGVAYSLRCETGNIKIKRYRDGWDYLQLGSGTEGLFTFELCKENSCDGASSEVNVDDKVYFKIPDRPFNESRLGISNVASRHWWLTTRSPLFAEPFTFKKSAESDLYTISHFSDLNVVFFKARDQPTLELEAPGYGQLTCTLKRAD
ncbi:hypothetical protein BGZ73_007823 [Actinomortierella ambigua]|nr:hypothetical protein BGZ73_007823 [Actinomortierella ambigua]